MRNVKCKEGLPFAIKPWIDITDTLISKSPDPEPVRTLEQITHLSIHHSAVEGATIESYANYHVKTNGWYHIGYHNVIKLDQLYQTNDWFTKSYHTSSNNGYTLSCSVSGDLSKRPLSEVERINLYAWALTCLDIFPNLKVENILGHNEYPDNKTACPCIDMSKVREDITKLQISLNVSETWEARKLKLGNINNQINYMDGLILKGEGNGDASWALHWKEQVYEIMKSQKLL